ncbi:bifunctional DNA primase/polymerase [Actinokineospora inagensis]|uniref:bifunctional DNA primase/polymerase n=1 Tax=Actinokineospora inagensis TaxID=103730 RepID=UPI000414A371|nr:bifunctional DNA primase/polymerase [Actinokineospora inagensis]
MSTADVADAAVAASWLATRLGWRVLPLNPGSKTPLGGCTACRATRQRPVAHTAADCACLARGNGALCHAVWAASADPDVIAWWARRCRTTVWAVNLGASGLLAVDLDTHGGTAPREPLHNVPWPTPATLPASGIDTFTVLAGLHGAGLDTDTTLCTRTPSGGLHLIYTAEVARWKSSSARVHDNGTVGTGLGWQIDIKAHGGYVVLPGSLTTAGHYRRASTATRPLPLPAWLSTALTHTGHDRHTTPTTPHTPPAPRRAVTGGRGERYAAAALHTACAELAAMTPGGRNRKLFRSSSSLAAMVAAGWIDRATVETDLAAAATAARLPASEIGYAIASGFRRPRRTP